MGDSVICGAVTDVPGVGFCRLDEAVQFPVGRGGSWRLAVGTARHPSAAASEIGMKYCVYRDAGATVANHVADMPYR